MLALVLALALSADEAASTPEEPTPAPEEVAPAPEAAVDARAVTLEAIKPSLFGPIFGTSVGAVVAFWGAYIAVVGFLNTGERAFVWGGAAIGVLGLALDAVTIVRMVQTIRERREISRQIEALALVLR